MIMISSSANTFYDSVGIKRNGQLNRIIYFDINSALIFQHRHTHSHFGIYLFIYWNIFVDMDSN